MSNRTYSTTDRLSSKARSGAGERGSGGTLLDGIVILSGVLSAIFFWSFSQNVFVNVYPPVALLLGLIVGLMPAEGAFFGWKRIRATKTNLTSSQLTATSWGLVAAVVCSIFSTIALFVATVPFVPADIAAYADWLVFLSLAIPTPLQVSIIAYYSINERSTVENHERAKLQALGFDAWVKAEAARMQSIIDGINIALDKQLESYGRNIGEQEAGQMLNDGGRELLGMGQPRTHHTPLTAVTRPDKNSSQVQNDGRYYVVMAKTLMGVWEETDKAEPLQEALKTLALLLAFGQYSTGILVDSQTMEPHPDFADLAKRERYVNPTRAAANGAQGD